MTLHDLAAKLLATEAWATPAHIDKLAAELQRTADGFILQGQLLAEASAEATRWLRERGIR
jgi:hypothetical protein